jgi:hypothetical protein
MLRKALVLPLTFPVDFCGCGSFYSVGSGGNGVTGNMGGCGGMAGRTCGKSSCSFIGITSSSMGGYCGGARIATPYFASCPRSSCCNSFPWPVIFRICFLEVWKYMLGTVGSPEHQ